MSEIIELAKCPACGYMFGPFDEDDEGKAWCIYCDHATAIVKKYRIEEVEDE